MAGAVAGKRMVLAVDGGRWMVPSQVLFAADHTATHIFTAWQPSIDSGTLKADRYLEKVISLEVKVVRTPNNVPRLMTKKWIAGLWFIDEVNPQQVLLPYPASFDDLRK